MERISRDDLNKEIVLLIAKRSICQRLQVGCIILKNGRIVSTGYNGPVRPFKGASQCTCDVTTPCDMSVHAEANAIAFAARNGVNLQGADMVLTHTPCRNCADLIIQSGINRVYYLEPYRVDYTPYLESNGVVLIKL